MWTEARTSVLEGERRGRDYLEELPPSETRDLAVRLCGAGQWPDPFLDLLYQVAAEVDHARASAGCVDRGEPPYFYKVGRESGILVLHIRLDWGLVPPFSSERRSLDRVIRAAAATAGAGIDRVKGSVLGWGPIIYQLRWERPGPPD